MADPPERPVAPAGPPDDGQRGFDRKLLLPGIVIAALILVPIAIWAAGSGGTDDGLRVEQDISPVTGAPEIVVGIPKRYNTMAESSNKANVVLVCFDAGGRTLLEANQDWPFIDEPGYDLPHVHQTVSDSQLKAMARCMVRGLEHELSGNLRRS